MQYDYTGMGKIHEERGRNFWMLLPLDSWAWFTILHFPTQIFMKQRKTQKSPRYHKLRILFNASNSLEGITPHYDVDGKIEKLWWLTHIYLRDSKSQPEKSKKVPFHHQHCPFHHTLRSSIIRKKHGHVGALPDQSTECLRWCQNFPGLKSPITDDGLKPTKRWKSTYGTITFIYLYKIMTVCLCINFNENIF